MTAPAPDGGVAEDLRLYLEFAVPLRIREIRHAQALTPADWTPRRLLGDINRGIAAFASRGDAVQYPAASRKARGLALDGLVTAAAAAVVLYGPLDLLGTHLCAAPHRDCPLSAPQDAECPPPPAS